MRLEKLLHELSFLSPSEIPMDEIKYTTRLSRWKSQRISKVRVTRDEEAWSFGDQRKNRFVAHASLRMSSDGKRIVAKGYETLSHL